jgi:glutamyl-tRNA reductase
MKLAELQVLHLQGSDDISRELPGGRPAAEAGHAMLGQYGLAWITATCQRLVAVTHGRAAREDLQRQCAAAAQAQVYTGAEAYAFLLRFACGLESKLSGETEVFGQVKDSWRRFSAHPSLQSRHLDGIVQMLFQDTKEVRARQLSGLGSASYGSQVRRLLGTPASGPTLLLGAGQLAQAVAPWLRADELLIWNRSPARAADLARLVRERHPERGCAVLDSEEEELAAWSRAGDVVLCVPVDPQRDALRLAAWRSRGGHAGRIVHLGLGDSVDPTWQGVSGLTGLASLFDMVRTQNEQRQLQVARARRVCAEKAVLRSLGSSATQPHGWEDLAAFATIAP